jgi:hypothetical protein
LRKNAYAIVGYLNINDAFTIFQGRNRQRTLEAQLTELTAGSGQDFSSPEGSSGADEVCVNKT